MVDYNRSEVSKRGAVVYKQNLHIHTTYADGKDKPEALVQEAIQKGFTSIGFSEHSYMPYSRASHQMTLADMEDYKAEIRYLKEKYRGVIDIFCGIEMEMFSNVPTDGLDYTIGSVHYLELEGKPCGFDRKLQDVQDYLATHFGGNGMAFAEKYFETLSQMPERHSVDIIGHFDILTKNNEMGGFIPVTDPGYLKMGIEAIHNLKGKIPLFEVNTGAIARGYRTAPYPQMEFLREFQKCGFGAVITSDCHNKQFLDCFYEEAKQLLAAVGFRAIWILTDDGFREVAL